MLFEYTGLNKDNKKTNGQIDASSEKEVVAYIKSLGMFPVSIKRKEQKSFGAITKILQRVTDNDITYMTRQLAIMLNAGLTIIDSIEIIQKQVMKEPLINLLNDINKNLRAGNTIAQSLRRHPQHFSNFYIALVESGEASGKLDTVLNRLADNLERAKEYKQKVKNALIYPIMIVTAMAIMIFIMLAFVFPKLITIYEEFDVELPQITVIVIAVSKFLEQRWYVVVLAVIGMVIGIKRLIKTPRGKIIYDKLILKVPAFGGLIKTSSLVDATRTFSILIQSGVSILESLRIVVEVNENTVFKNAFKNVIEKVQKGFSIGTAMSNEAVFPHTLVQMVVVGEQTGHLDETLEKISLYYQSESESAMKAVLTLIEPLILAVLGVVVGILIAAIITPIFGLANNF